MTTLADMIQLTRDDGRARWFCSKSDGAAMGVPPVATPVSRTPTMIGPFGRAA